MDIPAQFLNKNPQSSDTTLSSLQLAASYYMVQGQQVPFFVNHDFLRECKTFFDSGIITPLAVGVPDGLSVVAKGDAISVIRRAQDCGVDENRYEEVFVGNRGDILPNSWSFTGITIRGGSVANGAGGPWGTGGLSSQDPTPNNSVNRQPDIVTNLTAAYGANAAASYNGLA